jgi:chromosome segregation ATPase
MKYTRTLLFCLIIIPFYLHAMTATPVLQKQIEGYLKENTATKTEEQFANWQTAVDSLIKQFETRGRQNLANQYRLQKDQKIMEYMSSRTARFAQEKEEAELLIQQLLNELTRHQQELAQAKEKQNTLERDLRDAAEKIRRGEIANQQERDQLQARLNEFMQLSQEAHQRQRELEMIQKELQDKIAQLKQELEKQKLTTDEERNQQRILLTQISNLQNALQKNQGDLDKEKNENSRLTKTIDDLSQQIQKQMHEIELLKAQFAKEFDALKRELEQAKRELEKRQDSIKKMIQEYEQLKQIFEQTNALNKEQAQVLERLSRDLKDAYAFFEKEKATLLEELTKLKDQTTALKKPGLSDEERKALMKEIEDLKEVIGRREQDLLMQEQTYKKLKEEVTNLQKTIAEQELAIKKQQDQMQQEINKLKARADQTIKTLEETLRKTEEERTKLQEQLRKSLKKQQELKEKLKSLKKGMIVSDLEKIYNESIASYQQLFKTGQVTDFATYLDGLINLENIMKEKIVQEVPIPQEQNYLITTVTHTIKQERIAINRLQLEQASKVLKNANEKLWNIRNKKIYLNNSFNQMVENNMVEFKLIENLIEECIPFIAELQSQLHKLALNKTELKKALYNEPVEQLADTLSMVLASAQELYQSARWYFDEMITVRKKQQINSPSWIQTNGALLAYIYFMEKHILDMLVTFNIMKRENASTIINELNNQLMP